MKKLIVMMGGQGVGKGTFANMLTEKYGYRHVETGAILRSAPADSEIAKTIARGELVSDDLLFDLVSASIGTGDVVLDGFPRTISQAKWLVENFANKFEIHVVYLEISEELMMERINKRIREGGGRADDADMAAVQRRLKTFWDITVPAIDWLRSVSNIKFSVVTPDSTDVNHNFALVVNALNG